MSEIDEEQILKQAMAIARSRRDPVKLAESARTLASARIGKKVNDETRAKLTEGQARRRNREKAERAALAADTVPEPKRPRGRPKKSADTEPA